MMLLWRTAVAVAVAASVLIDVPKFDARVNRDLGGVAGAADVRTVGCSIE